MMQRWKELAAVFLKLGAVSYGGAATTGIMYAEIAGKRRWLTDARYLEGMGFVNVLPGPPAVQLAVFIGYERAGWTGGVLAGLAFILPAFFILMGLTLLYSAYGEVGAVRDALGGIGAAVLAIFGAAVYRLGRSALKDRPQIALAVVAALLLAGTKVGVAPILLLAACAGVALYHSRAYGGAAGAVVIALWACVHLLSPDLTAASDAADGAPPTLLNLAAFFLKVSALTFGGGMAIIVFVQEQVVNRMQWLTSREFLDGLALGQLTPGPVVMIAAYVGYKLAGIAGAIVAALCIFAPAFFLVLPLMPVLERFEHLLWLKAAIRGIGPAVIGCLAVTLAQLFPHAVQDAYAALILALAAATLVMWRVSPLPLILGSGLLGIGVRAAAAYA
ncbi:MAG TPA: chromate efflux transporter [Burkholderiales bacterium]|nr:chromate efflux transporter [Burkholderiales bacterium]